jgi:branched-chain amino acid transport system permease protein
MSWKRLLPIFAILFAASFPLFVRDPYFLHAAIMVLLFGYLASSWNVLGGLAGQHSFGHSAFFGIGAYVSTILFLYGGVPPLLGMIIGGIIAAAVSLGIGYPCFKLRGPYFALATLAFTEIFRIVVTSTEQIGSIDLKGAAGILIPLRPGSSYLNFQFPDKVHYYYIILAMLVLILFIYDRIEKSRWGLYLAAIRDNEEAARSIGISATRYKMVALAISAFFGATAGTFYAQFLLYIEPALFSSAFSIEILLIAIVGGAGTLLGPFLGALILSPISELTRTYLGGTYAGVQLIIYGAVLVAVMMFAPQGLILPLSRRYHALFARRRQ